MSLSDVIRNIAKTVTNKDEMKEKAKDLPLLVVQTTLSAAGQALLLVDRVKNSIKGIGSKAGREEEEYDSRPTAAEQVAAAPAETEQDKPARKEPVIFAPRPGASEPNGAPKTKPGPVIFAPAGKPDTAEATETAEKPEKAAEAESVAVAEPVTAPGTATKTEVAPEPEVVPEPEAAPKPAKARSARTTKVAKSSAKPAEAEVPKGAEPTPAAEPVVAPEPAPAAEPATSATVNLVEPLPGYADLTVASLRARMRGKTTEQMADLLAYERATAARPEVIKMFENRLAKLRAGE